MKKAVILSLSDNVATALERVEPDDIVGVFDSDKKPVQDIVSLSHIDAGHKIAACDIEKGSNVVKYGYVIGKASEFIKKGSLVHVSNLESLRGRGDLA
ncbi:UxaA family hydrolase [Lachnospiraceae bacterium NSJ-143]|nr:UxaA family hydrolase [Lachnospiraceae bacterium NSJ-143]